MNIVDKTNRRLAIELTYDCNYRCPWCDEANHVGTRRGPMPPTLLEKLMLHIKEHPYKSYGLQGGEPLIYPKHMFEIIDIIRGIQPDAEFVVFTNGALLTDALVGQLNRRNVIGCISLETSGYKDISRLIANAAEPGRVLHNIRNLRNKSFRLIATRKKLKDETLAAELLLLHSLFPADELVVSLDYTDMPNYTPEDIELYAKQLRKLSEAAPDAAMWYVPMQGFSDHCELVRERFVLECGDIVRKCSPKDCEEGGCRLLKSEMQPKVYKKYVNLIADWDAKNG